MNYSKIYMQLMIKRSIEQSEASYVERHHVIPVSLGGIDHKNNIVSLSAKEHFVAHLLLSKMFEKGSRSWIKMNKALGMMRISSSKQQRYSSRTFEAYRKNLALAQSLSQSGKGNSQYGKKFKWIIELNSGKKSKVLLNSQIPENCMLLSEYSRSKLSEISNEKRELNFASKVEEAKYWMELYEKSKSSSVRNFVRESDYPYSHVSFTKMIKKYLPDIEIKQGKPLKLS